MQLFRDDVKAAEALKDGDMRALEYFYKIYQDPLFHFLKAYFGDQALAAEMTQDAFLQLWESKGKINAEKSIKNLLYTIAKNKASDQLRKLRNQEKLFKLQQYTRAESFSTMDQVILSDYNRLLSNALLQLPARNREVFNLSRTSRLSNVEISEELNISVKAVEKHITKTLHFLKAILRSQHIMVFLLLIVR